MSDPHIEREVNRRLASATQSHNDELADLQKLIREQQEQVVSLFSVVQRMTSDPFYFATVISVNNVPEVSNFCADDEVIVTDKASRHCGAVGTILNGTPVVASCNQNRINAVEHTFIIGGRPVRIQLRKQRSFFNSLC